MKDWYFYQDKGETVGPLELEDLKGRIKEGRIRLFDLVYKDGESAWKLALEHSVLRGEFKPSALADLKERPWVCLRRKSKDALDFVTAGPFTTSEVSDSLQSGSLSYSDYAWKDGFSEWKRIGALEEFNRRARTAPVPPVPSLEPADELLKNVVELRKALGPAEEPPPPEAELPTVVGPMPGKTKKARTPSTPPPAPMAKSPAPEPKKEKTETKSEAKPEPKAETKSESKTKKKRPFFDWSLVAIFAMILMLAIFVFSKIVMRAQKSEPAESPPPVAETRPAVPPPVAKNSVPESAPAPPVKETEPPAPPPEAAEAKPEQVAKGSEPEKPVKAEPKVPAHHPPETFRISVQSHGANPPSFEIRTDASPDISIYLQVFGLPGQVLSGGSVYRMVRVHPTGSLGEPVAINNVKLPAGHYVARLDYGDLHKETKFFVGQNDAKFRGELSHQRKLWSAALWKERLALFRVADALEKQITQALVPSKHFTPRGWEALLGLSRWDGSKHLMSDDWWELHEIVKAAKSGVSGTLAARARRERDHLASFSVWK